MLVRERGVHCHAEGPQRAGEVGGQESHALQPRELQITAPREE